MSLSMKCEKCGHDTALYDLIEAARIIERHPESLRRYVRYGDVEGIKIERGVYFTQANLVRELEKEGV